MVPENIVTQKVGPLPLVVWVGGGAALIFVFIMMRGRSSASNNQTNQISSLAPTEAEAFGTIEQQQQDVTNALTTLGNNQSALGGSMSTLTGIVTQQGQDNAAAFQNLVNGQNSITGLVTNYGNQTYEQAAAANTYSQKAVRDIYALWESTLQQSAGVDRNNADYYANIMKMLQNFSTYASNSGLASLSNGPTTKTDGGSSPAIPFQQAAA